MHILGIFHSYSDPSAALISDGKVVGFVEEERLIRDKHAVGHFPNRAITSLLKSSNLNIQDIDHIAQAWDSHAYDSGEITSVYDAINRQYSTEPNDIEYQQKRINTFKSEKQKDIIHGNLRRLFGANDLPPIEFVRHHLAHACMAYFQSGMDEALVMVIDGSGESVTTSWWLGQNQKLTCLREISIPHSLGWFYSAFTEYLGFRAYDGEYKVMGLAAYGKPDLALRDKLSKIVWSDSLGGFETDPMLLSRGPRSHSYYYPDKMIEFIGPPPRADGDEITSWHMSLAYEVQKHLESVVMDMVAYWTQKTGIKKLAIAGGVGLNVKMNGNLFLSNNIDDLFVHPLCADAGISIGGALAHLYMKDKLAPSPLRDIYYGPSFDEAAIETILQTCKLDYERKNSITKSVAQLLADGKIVAWFQGNMEAGPRSLGNRSILADPRYVSSRDRVNAVIKYREFWRPFCPSLTVDGAKKYLEKYTHAPFMIITFRATELAKQEIPAVVHVDGTSRPQIVEEEDNPLYHELLSEFELLTGTPCLLNTSFNVKGEPVVCSPHDAIRTFFATGLDALAIGPFLIQKGG